MAQVRKDAAFPGKGLKAEPRKEGTSNAVRSMSDQPCSKLRRKIHQLQLLFGCREGTQYSPKHQGGDRSAGCLPCPHRAGGPPRSSVGDRQTLHNIHALVQPSFRTLSITAFQLANSSLSSCPLVGSRAPLQCPSWPSLPPASVLGLCIQSL